MFIDQYKKEDGFYYDEHGACYEDAEEFICTYILGFCGCGMPDSALEHVYKALQLVAIRHKMKYEEWADKCREVFANHGAEYFMWYYLDNKGFTEHGGSVPGWLTADGEELLSDLTELVKGWENTSK